MRKPDKALSSRGLGRVVLSHQTRVRIPVALPSLTGFSKIADVEMGVEFSWVSCGRLPNGKQIPRLRQFLRLTLFPEIAFRSPPLYASR